MTKNITKIATVLAMLLALGCGGDSTSTKSADTAATTTDPFTALAKLNVASSVPNNGDGIILVDTITNVPNASGGDQFVHISAKTNFILPSGEVSVVLHEIDITYTISFVASVQQATVTNITHSWGTSLTNSVDGGISFCSGDCNSTTLDPNQHTVVFNNQLLPDTSTISTLDGTIIYP